MEVYNSLGKTKRYVYTEFDSFVNLAHAAYNN